MKRLFVGITKQNRRMKMRKTSHFKPVRAGLKTLKRGPVPHWQLVWWPQPMTPPCASWICQSQGSALIQHVCFGSGCSLDFIYCTLKNAYSISFSLVFLRPPKDLHSGCSSGRLTLKARVGPLLYLPERVGDSIGSYLWQLILLIPESWNSETKDLETLPHFLALFSVVLDFEPVVFVSMLPSWL